jgi:ABC-2 type transport system ATP-binding protein
VEATLSRPAGVPLDNNGLAVDAVGVVKRFKKVAALQSVDLKVRVGEVHVIAGHNGAGKSTLFKIIVGLIRRDAGKVNVLGVDPSTPAMHDIIKQIGYVPEDASPYERLTGYEYLRFFARLYAERPEEVDDIVSRGVAISGLGDKELKRKAGEYSNGMKRRLLIARALMYRPSLVLLDEPTNGLDVFSAHDVRQLIKSLSRGGVTFIIATHNMAEAEYLADRVTFMAYGKSLFTGTPKEAMETFNGENLEDAFVKAVRSLEAGRG